MKIKKYLALFLIVLNFSLLLVGCSSGKDQEEGKLETVDLVLDWYPNAIHTFIYTAEKNGYFEEEGLKVNIQFPSSTNDALSLAAAGKADVGIYYIHNIIETNVEQNVPIRSIGSITQGPLTIFNSLKESNITSPKDLVGKTVGTGSEMSEKIIKYMMKSQGLDENSVSFVDIGFDHLSALTTGNVDATFGSMVNHEVPQLEKEGFEVNYFFPTDYGMPNYYEMSFITGEKQLEEESDKLIKFMRACKKGFEDVKANPEEALDYLFEKQNAENFPLDRGVETKSLEILLPIMDQAGAEFLSQDIQIWQKNIDWLYENGIISKTINAEEIVVNLAE